MGVTIIGKSKEEIKHLISFVGSNVKDVKKFLIIYITPPDKDEKEAISEIEPLVKEVSGGVPYEIKTFTGSPDTAIETFLAKREDIRMVFLHIERLDIKEILEEDRYGNILKKLQKGVIRIPVVFVPHHEG